MSYIITILLDGVDLFFADIPGLPITGANLVTSVILKQFCKHEDVECMEVFLSPEAMARVDLQAKAAANVLAPELRGKGRLRFYPIHSLPDVWQDARPRIMYCLDPEWMARTRYIRDKYAVAPTAIYCDMHALGHHRLWSEMTPLSYMPHVPFDSIVCLSKSSQAAMQKAFESVLKIHELNAPCRIDIIPRGVDTNVFHPFTPESKRDARRILHLPDNATITLYLGRVSVYGKADLLPLVRIFAEASSRPEDILVIAGEEFPVGYGEKLREFGNELGLGERLIVLPRVQPSLRPLYYGASDIFVFPGDTIQETFGTTVIEAMACGLPCIVSDWDGMRDIVIDDVTGYKISTYWMPELTQLDDFSPATPIGSEYLFESQRVWVDAPHFIDKLSELLMSADRRLELGKAGRKRAESEYSIDKIVNKMLGLCGDLLSIAKTEFRRNEIDSSYLSHPTPYDTIFQHYAKHTIDINHDEIRLSSYGLLVAGGKTQMKLYDETLCLVRSDVMQAILQALLHAGSLWTSIGHIVLLVEQETNRPHRDILFHISILLKRDMLELRHL